MAQQEEKYGPFEEQKKSGKRTFDVDRQLVEAFYKEEEEFVHRLFKEELTRVIPKNYWEQLCQYNSGIISLHTINVLMLCARDPFYQKQFTECERNIVKWAGLLHDISKRGWPLFKEKDHVHAFLSARSLLIIVQDMGLLVLETEEERRKMEEVLELLDQSQRPIQEVRASVLPQENVCQFVHSHKHLPKIMAIMWSMKQTARGTFMDLLFRLILLHQSLYGLLHY